MTQSLDCKTCITKQFLWCVNMAFKIFEEICCQTIDHRVASSWMSGPASQRTEGNTHVTQW